MLIHIVGLWMNILSKRKEVGNAQHVRRRLEAPYRENQRWYMIALSLPFKLPMISGERSAKRKFSKLSSCFVNLNNTSPVINTSELKIILKKLTVLVMK